MIENLDLSVVNWSRAQFALTAMYHWLFVPLTLGLSFLIAIFETLYVRTGNEEWKRITKFWMTLFGINFAIGVATGIILEFEFGTNWSNYSWFVGDIFGAPLAIEGIMAFFMESTFIAIMFFGWNKVSKRFHLTASWLTAIGANLSALWILVANGWMQYPIGMTFNSDTARNEMTNFWEVLLSPVAVNKFLHTVTSGYVLASVFVLGVSAWYLLKGREILMAKRSIIIAGVFGLISSLFLAFTGDGSAYQVAQKQPMKLAAMEGLYNGTEGAGLVAVGMLTPGKTYDDGKDPFVFKIEIPKLLSMLSYKDANAFVPGVKDIIDGYVVNDSEGIPILVPSAQQKIDRGRIAIQALSDYRKAKMAGDSSMMMFSKMVLQENFAYFGYGYLNNTSSIIPNVPLTFYSFHVMVALGFFFILLFGVVLWLTLKKELMNHRWLLYLMVVSVPLVYIAQQAGWIVAEVGRQPWVIQDLLPTVAAVSRIDASAVQVTFWMFGVLFTVLLIAELRIMFKAIKTGPNDGGH
ncbi:cytochrome ubiquinol oxidase subunit I [Williamwhitmania taraxaci]|uniref:Cytochrome bd-I ubiquinol oxidase subunit 1 apoprotein n=1 Tax=Williamwhitmania taraxaci TaxID=1640674 RepID=A0A1G6SKN1_9BACT|nr:cytochrome ubiquinol oxidase subunit I [Williamwhitmania taraxaci]SDD16676.1 cytochrome bd-I ubiquinol oxidase subunit 1 apoprotein [Williamwhitmania taraxaci]